MVQQIAFKGHSILKQYVKGKPIQWGFKLWCRCAAKTGYLYEFDLYTGKKIGHIEHGLGEGVVLPLTEKIIGSHCEIFIDNFFNSPQLQLNLLQRSIFSAGAVRTNRKGLPKQEKVPTDKEMAKGEMVCMASNDILYTKWMDSKAVHMLSNFLLACPVHEISRRIKGSRTSKIVKCPDVLEKYNQFMGGVDLMDQKKVTYQFSHRSSHKYYIRLVFDIVDIAVNNAAIVYEKVNRESSANAMDLKAFRCCVARGLIDNYCSRKRAIPYSVVLGSTKRLQQQKNSSTSHTMMKIEVRKRCKLCYQNKIQNCTNNVCVECDVALCYVNDRNCFALYHNQ